MQACAVMKKTVRLCVAKLIGLRLQTLAFVLFSLFCWERGSNIRDVSFYVFILIFLYAFLSAIFKGFWLCFNAL